MRVFTIVGARPQFIKLAPVSRAMKAYGEKQGTAIEDIIVHTGQHYDPEMSAIFFDELQIPEPAVDLAIGSGSHGVQTALMLQALEESLIEYNPDVVVVYGDTNSTLAGALAAAKLHFPVAHIEAGLRSFDRRMPEEVNRIIADHISDVLFSPTETAMLNLRNENLASRAYGVGDVMLDAVLFNRELATSQSSILAEMGLEDNRFVAATIHRAANTDSGRLGSLLEALNTVASEIVPVIFPAHPRTLARIERIYPEWRAVSDLRIIKPVGYLDMLRLTDAANAVMTDSGGLQKEAFFLGTPCLTLRDETEWPETVSAGRNTLVGADTDKIVSCVERVVRQSESNSGDSVANGSGQFGDGDAAGRIVRHLVELVDGKNDEMCTGSGCQTGGL